MKVGNRTVGKRLRPIYAPCPLLGNPAFHPKRAKAKGPPAQQPASEALTDERERAAFEAWCRNVRKLPTRRLATLRDAYADPEASSAWFAWQARAALSAGKPSAPIAAGLDDIANMTAEQVAEARLETIRRLSELTDRLDELSPQVTEASLECLRNIEARLLAAPPAPTTEGEP